ncbi:S24 family peptidase [Chryseobacterium ginsenosidimutans]|uniref:S24 family peptidase n=1 Tax=Chryseobacterium ginsenosidimutans TaxID=687846 RepID=UPI0031D7F883
MTRIQRVKKVIKWLIFSDFGENETEIAKLLGYTKSSFSQILNEKVPLSERFVDKLCDLDKDINKVWIMHEEGVMLNNSTDYKVGQEFYNTKVIDSVIDNNTVPLYDLEATAGVAEVFANNPQSIPIDHITIPNLPKCDGALFIRGDSMYPLLKSGDIVAYKIINDVHNIIWGEMYLIQVIHNNDEYFFCKFLKKSLKQGYVEFISQNQHHQNVEFPIESIKALALVKASIRYNTIF